MGTVLAVRLLLLVSLIVSAALAAFSGWRKTRVPELRFVLPVLDWALSFGMTVVLFATIVTYTPHVAMTLTRN